MENGDILILDRECFKAGVSIVDNVKNKAKIENILQKSLGVLQEEGVFAFIVYLNSIKKGEDKEVSEKIIGGVIELLKKNGIRIITNNISANDPNSILQKFIKLGNNIDDLLFAKTLIEKTLIYAMYRAKSLEDKTI